MGDRYILTVECPTCHRVGENIYYAPTCGSTSYKCSCGRVIDLAEYSGISYEDASNAAEIASLISAIDPSPESNGNKG